MKVSVCLCVVQVRELRAHAKHAETFFGAAKRCTHRSKAVGLSVEATVHRPRAQPL